MDKYYVNGEEVTKEQYVAAERRNGFRNTLGFPNEPATASWSRSVTNGTRESGWIEYGRDPG